MPFTFNAVARLGGQKFGVNFSASTGWGSSPASISIVAPADAFQQVTSRVNNLIIRQGNMIFRFRDVQTRSVEEAEPSGAGLIKFTVEDRRWRWQFGSIDGDYNVVNEDGTLKREKTPRQLATLLAIAIGERGMDVKALPNVARPRKTWRASRAIDELDQLCRDLGCVIVFNGHRDRASIHRVGAGAEIPQQPVVSESRGLTMPAWPSEIVIDTSPTLFQRGLEFFEAVGLDTDGKIKPINQLAYAPAGGWKMTDPIDFIDITTAFRSGGELIYARDLAARSVWKWYRITGVTGGGWSPAALKNEPRKPTSKDDIGPFLGTRLDRDFATGNRLPSIAVGAYYDGRENFQNKKEGSQVKIDFSINEATKCIEFSEPVYLMDPDSKTEVYKPAKITVYTGFSVSVEGVPVRYKRTKKLKKNWGAGPRVEIHDEIVREITEQSPFGGIPRDNLERTEKECDALLTAMVAEYQEFPTANPTLPYLGDFACDGILRSIQWDAGTEDAVTTQLAYNGELNEFLPDPRDTPAARQKRITLAADRQRAAIRNGQLKPAPEI